MPNLPELRAKIAAMSGPIDTGSFLGWRKCHREVLALLDEAIATSPKFMQVELSPEGAEELRRILSEPSTCTLVPCDIPAATLTDREAMGGEASG